MSDRKEESQGINVWKVDQGGSRCGMGEVEGEDDSSRGWPGSVDML